MVLDVQANLVAVVVALALALGACRVDDAMPPTPAAAATDAEARAAARLRDHLRAVPGVADASVVVAITPADPFARDQAPRPPRVALAVATTAGADTAVIGDAAVSAARVALGADVDVQVQIAPPPQAPRLVAVGPFDVSERSRGPLLVTLALALAALGGLAAALALALYRRGTRPHQSSTSTTRGS